MGHNWGGMWGLFLRETKAYLFLKEISHKIVKEGKVGVRTMLRKIKR